MQGLYDYKRLILPHEIMQDKPPDVYYKDEAVNINFNVTGILDAIRYRRAEWSGMGVVKGTGGHLPVYEVLERKIDWNKVVGEAQDGWYVTIGWATRKDASHLDECLFFGRKQGDRVAWYVALSQHNYVAWTSSHMRDLIVREGLRLAGRDYTPANRRAFGEVIEKKILAHSMLNGKPSPSGFSLGKELTEMIDEYKVRIIATQRKVRRTSIGPCNIMRAWDALGNTKITRMEKDGARVA